MGEGRSELATLANEPQEVSFTDRDGTHRTFAVRELSFLGLNRRNRELKLAFGGSADAQGRFVFAEWDAELAVYLTARAALREAEPSLSAEAIDGMFAGGDREHAAVLLRVARIALGWDNGDIRGESSRKNG